MFRSAEHYLGSYTGTRRVSSDHRQVCPFTEDAAGSYPTWAAWDAAQRDLYVVGADGIAVYHENITPGPLQTLVGLLRPLSVDDCFSVSLGLGGGGVHDMMKKQQ